MQQDGLGAALYDGVDVILRELDLTIDDDIVSLDGHNLARILVDEVLDPARQHTRRQLAAYGLLQVALGDLDLVGQIEYLEDLLVGLEAYGTQKSRDGQLLLAVDIGIHHIVDVRGELDP